MGQLLSTKYWRHAKIVRFLAVGVLNTCFGYLVFLALLWAGLNSTSALLAAWALGVLFNFGTVRKLVFTGQSGSLARFTAVYVALLAINWTALTLLGQLGIRAWIAQGMLTLPVALLSFSVQRRFVFVDRVRPV